MSKDKSYFFCGIGGSGMMPLASIIRQSGAAVAGSDRALDHGRSAAKFDWLRKQGIRLYDQDGSGVTDAGQIVIASAAVEESVPDIVAASALGCVRQTRAELLAELFNAAPRSVAIGGTSGKSTVTGMIGWIMDQAGGDPTIMNGAVMKNYITPDTPFASSRVGAGGLFVSEVDESDGSIALFRPSVAVLNNISLDHKSMEELHRLFGDFVACADHAVWNADDAESVGLMAGKPGGDSLSFGFSTSSDVRASDVTEFPFASSFTLHCDGMEYAVRLQVPGRHNIANALAALAAVKLLGVPLDNAVAAVQGFTGLARRFDRVGEASGITVIDDFGHNPDKIRATLTTMKAFPGRILAFFQPHGYGPIRVMGAELAQVLAELLGPDDYILMCDPVYFGGTVDRSIGAECITNKVVAAGGKAEHLPERTDCGKRLLELAQPGDRIVIMGARDDTLSSFAREIVAGLGE